MQPHTSVSKIEDNAIHIIKWIISKQQYKKKNLEIYSCIHIFDFHITRQNDFSCL